MYSFDKVEVSYFVLTGYCSWKKIGLNRFSNFIISKELVNLKQKILQTKY